MFPVPQVDADKCKSVIEICCLDERKNDQCKIGKDLAKLRRTCAGLQSRLGNEHKRVWSCVFWTYCGSLRDMIGQWCDKIQSFAFLILVSIHAQA